ncbi:hypothetical protein CW740_07500 [Kangiella profundi]|uniref:Uncharacterized protein n=1 Tax=Kangiella profundi TaxID=1561924 RepID=A0A2K9AYZ3_9GAMM|nr:hypothetical protein [Kangiella profundi]AUD79099.1 hypothetical protein CW740_07500 [Kangiella profundi]GGF01481.1 hypothetical protein GCM10011356_13990 [Kangiella profundi]
MSRLLYRCDNLAEIENTYKDLRDAGVEDAHLHVIAKQDGQLLRRGLNAANSWYKTDILNGWSQGVRYGLAAGIIASLFFAAFDVFSGYYGFIGIFFTLVIFTAFGTWLGGFIGLQSKNHALKDFYHFVDEGEYLLLIDLSLSEAKHIKGVLNYHPSLMLVSDEVETTIPVHIMERMH